MSRVINGPVDKHAPLPFSLVVFDAPKNLARTVKAHGLLDACYLCDGYGSAAATLSFVDIEDRLNISAMLTRRGIRNKCFSTLAQLDELLQIRDGVDEEVM